jgi:hypothetical protein
METKTSSVADPDPVGSQLIAGSAAACKQVLYGVHSILNSTDQGATHQLEILLNHA